LGGRWLDKPRPPGAPGLRCIRDRTRRRKLRSSKRPDLVRSGAQAVPSLGSFLDLDLDGRTHGDKATLGAGNGTADQQQLTSFVNAHDVQVLRGHGFVATVA